MQGSFIISDNNVLYVRRQPIVEFRALTMQNAFRIRLPEAETDKVTPVDGIEKTPAQDKIQEMCCTVAAKCSHQYTRKQMTVAARNGRVDEMSKIIKMSCRV